MKHLIDDKVLFFGRMKCGRAYVELTSGVGWDGFPNYVEEFIRQLSGRVVSRNDSVDTRVWEVIVKKQLLRLVYDDFPVMISLESQSEEGDRFIEELRGTLIK